jgi:cell division septation protein DedD
MANYRDLPIVFGSNRYHQRSTAGMLFTALILVSGVGGYFLYSTTIEAPPNIIPLIRAAETPIKTKPEIPGGMDVPNLDVEILNPPNADKPVVLGPSPEEPILFPETPTAEDVAGITQPPPLSEPNAVVTPAPAEIPKLNTIYRVQIASVRSEREAKEEWKRLKSKFPVLLRRLNLTVARVNLDEKGVFYRLLIGPLPDKSAAKEFCKSAKERKIACLFHKFIE